MEFVLTDGDTITINNTDRNGGSFDWLGQCNHADLDMIDIYNDNSIIKCLTDRADEIAFSVEVLQNTQDLFDELVSELDDERRDDLKDLIRDLRDKIWEEFCGCEHSGKYETLDNILDELRNIIEEDEE